MKNLVFTICAVLVSLFVAGASSCGGDKAKNEMEAAGEKMGDAADKAMGEMENAADQAGEAMDEAADKMEEKMEDAHGH